VEAPRLVRRLPNRLACVAVVAVLLAGAPGRGEEPAPTPPTTLPPGSTAIPPHEIATRDEQALREVADIRARVSTGRPIRALQAEVDALADRIKTMVLDDRPGTLTVLTPRDIDDRVREWRRMHESLVERAESVGRRLQAIDAGLARLREIAAVWQATADAAREASLPAPVLQTIGDVLKQVGDAERQLTADRDALLAVAAKISPLEQQVAGRIALIHDLSVRARGEIFAVRSPPLWSVLTALPSEPLAPVFQATWGRSLRLLGTHVEVGRMIARLLVFLVVLALAVDVRRRIPRWPPDDAEALARARRVAAYPVAGALLVALVVGTVIFPSDPVILTELSMLLSLPALALLVRDRLPGRLRTLVPALALVFVLALVRRQFPAGSAWGRVLLGFESLTALGWIVAAFGLPRRGRASPEGVWAVRAAWTAAAALGTALIANVVGAVALAILLDQSVVASLFLALGLYATADVLEGLIVAGLRPWRRYRIRAISTHLAQIRLWLVRAVRFAAAALWAVGTVVLLGAERQLAATLQRMLEASLTVGSLHLSVQGIVVFVVSVWLAVIVAGAVRALLEEDVLARMPLPRGVPSAISAAANYTILFLGILLAMSAAGLSLERVTLLAGAIGVGIGFGLQNVVNNFVSGLILLVERPMRIGDVVEIGTTVGTVRRIGIRSSTLRTFEGAEVIVPNGSLIAERLTNWTFSDYARRIEVRVAVADGAEPETVRTLLEQAARHEDVLPNPPPSAILVAVGEGKLTFVLRAWSPTYEQAPEVQSRLTAAVVAALRAANVDVR
jgi:small-conductance mechanosensitive channel